jgi:23S rRNA maturation mini-RNase III
MNPLICVNGNIHKSLSKKENCTMCASKENNKEKPVKEEYTCTNCFKTMAKKKEKYHKCKHNFQQLAEEAWQGDAMHRLMVIEVLRQKGYTRSSSSTKLVTFVSAESQVKYVLDNYEVISESDLSDFSTHTLSTLFESMFYRSSTFRRIYKNHLLLNIKHVLL